MFQRKPYAFILIWTYNIKFLPPVGSVNFWELIATCILSTNVFVCQHVSGDDICKQNVKQLMFTFSKSWTVKIFEHDVSWTALKSWTNMSRIDIFAA